jgi:enoyl-CoA hydratase/carnithine racemase
VGLTISNASTYLLPRLLGGRCLPVVLGGERIQADDAARLGLIDYLVDDVSAVLPKAVELARSWTLPGLATDLHLRMLRPPLDEIEKAIARENEFAIEGWNRNLAREAIGRFYSDRNDQRG